MKTDTCDLSVVIVNWNAGTYLADTVSSVLARHAIRPADIVVVDNHSSDDSVALLTARHPGVTLIRNSENVGFARANNQGIAATKSRYVFLLNPDTEVRPHALETMTAFMDAHPEAGACGPQIVDEKGVVQPTLIRPPLRHMLFTDTIFAKMFLRDPVQEPRFLKTVEAVDNLCGASLLLRRKALEDAGYLDENLFLYYEEPELLERLKRKKWLSYYLPHAEIVHYCGKSTRGVDPLVKILLHKRSAVGLWRSRYGAPVTALLQAGVAIMALAGLIAYLVLWPFDRRGVSGKIRYQRSLLLILLNNRHPMVRPG